MGDKTKWQFKSTPKTASEISAVQALVIPGGESTTISKLARAFGVFDLIAERIRGGLPTYGSCAGLILLLDRIARSNANRLFCGRSGQTFRYQIKDGSLNSHVLTLDGAEALETFNTSDRPAIGVGNVGGTPNRATYTIYSHNTDIVQFRTVRYGKSKGFGKSWEQYLVKNVMMQENNNDYHF